MNYLSVLFSLVFSFLFILFVPASVLEFFSVSLFFFIGFRFFLNIGQNLDFRDLIAFLSSFQWLFASVLSYHFSESQFYYMAVSSDIYFSYILPATLLLLIGLYLPIFKKTHSRQILFDLSKLTQSFANLDIIFILIGSITPFFSNYFPAVFGFIFFFISALKFIGLYLVFINKRPNKWIFVLFVIGSIFINSLSNAMFHELILWVVFTFMFFAFAYGIKTRQKTIYFSLIILLTLTIQLIKWQYRLYIYSDEKPQSKIGLFIRLTTERVTDEEALFEQSEEFITRFNQGWIISHILVYIPEYKPYYKGETFKETIQSSLVPRFLDPDKETAGGRELFSDFTGLYINPGTSMNISLVGEAYGNFGRFGGIICMFVIGVIINIILALLLRSSAKHSIIIAMLPLIFLQVVVAETSSLEVFNHLIKGIIFTYGLIFILRRFFGIPA